jgi:hypothetical protein
MDAWVFHGTDRWDASAAKFVKIDVQLGGGYTNPDAGADDRNGPLNLIQVTIPIDMQYTFSLTPRMLAIAVTCLIALCLLLFLAGIEIGQKMSGQTIMVNTKNIPLVVPEIKQPKVPSLDDLIAPINPIKP